MKTFIQKLSQQKKEINYSLHFQIPYGKILLCGIPTLFFYASYKTTLFFLNIFQPEFIGSLRTEVYLFLFHSGFGFVASSLSFFVFFGILLSVTILVLRTQKMLVK